MNGGSHPAILLIGDFKRGCVTREKGREGGRPRDSFPLLEEADVADGELDGVGRHFYTVLERTYLMRCKGVSISITPSDSEGRTEKSSKYYRVVVVGLV